VFFRSTGLPISSEKS